MKAILIKYKRTAEQEDKINSLLNYYEKIQTRPTLKNDNLLVRLTDDCGREFYCGITPSGEKLNTNLYW